MSKPKSEMPEELIIHQLKVLVAKKLLTIKIVGFADSFGTLNNIIVWVFIIHSWKFLPPALLA